MNFETGSVSLIFAFFHHHEYGNAHDRFCHRRNAENRVFGHRLVRLDVHQSLRLEMSDLSLAGDQRDRAGNVPRLDASFNQVVYSLQPLR